MKQLKRIHVALAMFFCLALMVSCATTQSTGTVSPLTPQQQFLMSAEKVYIDQNHDYMSMVAMPNLTDGQKAMLKTKKAIMIKAQKAIKMYKDYLDKGMVITPDIEYAVTDALNQLGGTYGH